MNRNVSRSFHIVSGGQTGVDRAALDAAMASGVSVGGWCPEGRLAEDGVIPEKYPLKALKGGGYPERTLQNVVDSDGTVIVYFTDLSGGTALTREYSVREDRPYILIDGGSIGEDVAAEMVAGFISQHDIGVLNVAGPRASKNDKAYEYTRDVLIRLFKLIKGNA